MNLRRFEDSAATVEAVAHHLWSDAQSAIAERGCYRLALTGGRTPADLYRRLATQDLCAQWDWPHVDLFWGDERCVLPDSSDSNYALAKSLLIDHIPVRPANVHRMRGEWDPARAAAEYARDLGDKPLDCILLGIGTDGHTASLFPGGPELAVSAPVVVTRSPVAPYQRVSLSLPTINAARSVVFLVMGGAKAQVLSEVIRSHVDDLCSQSEVEENRLPAARVRPTGGRLFFFVDGAAAARVGEGTP